MTGPTKTPPTGQDFPDYPTMKKENDNAIQVKITGCRTLCKQPWPSKRVREEDEKHSEAAKEGYTAEEAEVGFFAYRREQTQ